MQLTQQLGHSRVLFKFRATTALNPSNLVANFNIGGQVSPSFLEYGGAIGGWKLFP